MIKSELEILLGRTPFEPFRIKLINGDIYDVFDPGTVALLTFTISVAMQDQNWVLAPYTKINSIESLFADYQGKLHEHGE